VGSKKDMLPSYGRTKTLRGHNIIYLSILKFDKQLRTIMFLSSF